MKVLDLCCSLGHDFEGWFGSEEDFQSQLQRQLVQCPVCASVEISKKLSAPRLNLGATLPIARKESVPSGSQDRVHLARALYERMVQHVLDHTTDVGGAFADQARKMHYGEMDEAPIRGHASREEAESLREEGIDVMALALPSAARHKLQ